MELAAARWPDLADDWCEVAVVALGSCEQHGPHLPFVTDAAIADIVARRAVAALCSRGHRAVAAPALPYGASGEHQHFPGTISIGHEALRHVLVEVGRSVTTWTTRVVFVNGHGGNVPALQAACRLLRREGRDVSWVPCEPPCADAHAGRSETSLMQAVAPDSVRVSAAVAGPMEPIDVLLPRLREVGVIGVSPSGVLGDPAGASAIEGDGLLRWLVDDVVVAIESGVVDPSGRLRVQGGRRTA